jgi:hypothetical protein
MAEFKKASDTRNFKKRVNRMTDEAEICPHSCYINAGHTPIANAST